MTISLIMLILTVAILTYGAICDASKRIIPDRVPITLFLLGAAGALLIPMGESLYVPLNERMAGALIPAITLMVIYHFDKRIGGGDFKLLTAMGFCLGINALVPIMIITTITAAAWSFKSKQKSVPLAVILALGLYIHIFIQMGGKLI